MLISIDAHDHCWRMCLSRCEFVHNILGDPYEFVRKISTILLQNYTVVVVGMKEYTLVRGDGGRRAYISISIIQDQLKLAGLVVVMDRYYI